MTRNAPSVASPIPGTTRSADAPWAWS